VTLTTPTGSMPAPLQAYTVHSAWW